MSVLFAGCGAPGGTVIGATDRNGYAAERARPVAGEFRLDDLSQARHRPRQDLLHAARPPDAPGQRPDADQGTDGLSRRRVSLLPSRSASRLRSRVAVAAPPTSSTLIPAGAQTGRSDGSASRRHVRQVAPAGLDVRTKVSRSSRERSRASSRFASMPTPRRVRDSCDSSTKAAQAPRGFSSSAPSTRRKKPSPTNAIKAAQRIEQPAVVVNGALGRTATSIAIACRRRPGKRWSLRWTPWPPSGRRSTASCN